MLQPIEDARPVMSGPGGARRGAGRKRKPLATHIRQGTYRSDRHGPLPAHVHPLPGAAETDWAPSPADLEAQGAAGRALIERLLDGHTFTIVEGAVLLEAAHAATALAGVRRVARGALKLRELATLDRLELQWSRHYAGLLATLRVSA